jgi:hypothetical protein
VARDRRSRAPSRLGVERGERYALILEEVMNSAAYSAQPDFAKVVLFAVAARFNGYNNGNISLPIGEARKLGIASPWKLYAGLNLLRQAGLIQRTRQGYLAAGKKLCGLYALTWRGISEAPQGVFYDAGVTSCPLPANDWCRWVKPADWDSIVTKVKRDNHGRSKIPVSTARDNSRSTMLGTKVAILAQPRGGKEGPLPAPLLVDTSKTQGLGAEDALHCRQRHSTDQI